MPVHEATAGYRLRTPTPTTSAAVPRRLAQGALDALVSSLPPLPPLVLYPLLPWDAESATQELFVATGAAVAVLVVLLYAWYWVWRPARFRGQTPFMRLLGIRTVSTGGGPVRTGRLAIRWLLLPVDMLVVGLVSMLCSPRHQRIGDRLAGTVVVRDDVPSPSGRSRAR